jgi:hypothetical protein
MQVSFNELDARLKKAAKGAGLPWGLAEEFAKSLLLLAQLRVELGSWVVEFLADADSPSLLAEWSYELDLSKPPSEKIACSAAQHSVWLGFTGRYAKLQGVDIAALTDIQVTPQGVVYDLSVAGPSERTSSVLCLRAEVHDEVWQQLENLEFKTYAPESESSRLKGAGAGVTDND